MNDIVNRRETFPLSMIEVLVKQIQWSEKTFGVGQRTKGVTAHMLKELIEVREDPSRDEWADLMILAFDGLWRQIQHEYEQADQGIPTHAELVSSAIDSYRRKVQRNTLRNFSAPKDEDTPSEAADSDGKVRWKPTDAIFKVIAERKRQVENHGFTPAFDLQNNGLDGVGLSAAAMIAAGCTMRYTDETVERLISERLFDEISTDKDERTLIVEGAALAVAELEMRELALK